MHGSHHDGWEGSRQQTDLTFFFPYWHGSRDSPMNVQKGYAQLYMKSTVRMTGSDTLLHTSDSIATHHSHPHHNVAE